MTALEPLELGREAYARQAWGDAYARLSGSDAGGALAVEDLERLATAAHMLGRVDDETRAWERAHQAAVREGKPGKAARHAFHLVMGFGRRGEFAQAGAWFARAERLVDEAGPDCV